MKIRSVDIRKHEDGAVVTPLRYIIIIILLLIFVVFSADKLFNADILQESDSQNITVNTFSP